MTGERRTVAALLAASGLPATEARALLARLMAVRREALIASPERTVDAAVAARFDAWSARRRDGLPLAYLLGEKEFYGRTFGLTRDVLVPRPDTELLVDETLRVLRGRSNAEPPRVLDLGTGCGCIAVTLALEVPGARVTAVDASADALRVAEANARGLRATVTFALGDWFAVAGLVPGETFDVIVSNPPYVAAGDPHLPDLRHEPASALVSGADGLDALREITAQAPRYLAAGGWLLVEHGHDQGDAVRVLFANAGFEAVETRRDAAGHERVTAGHAPFQPDRRAG